MAVYALVLLVPPVVLGGIGSMLYLGFHDDLVASLMARQSAQQYAYEDRIEALRNELERQMHHHVSDQAALESRVQDLVLREARLESRAAVVAGLRRTGIARAEATDVSWVAPSRTGPTPSRALDPPFGAKPDRAELPEALLSYAPGTISVVFPPTTIKPHPEPVPIDSESSDAKAPGPFSALDQSPGVPARLSLVSASLDDVEEVQLGTLVRIGARARDEASRLKGVLEEVGLTPDRFTAKSGSGVGGPLVPLDDVDTPFGRALSGLHDTLASADRLRDAVRRAPLAAPVPGVPEITSPFGARKDPFLGRPAMHTGVDLKEGYGADVRSTAGGRVAFAGVAGGYGNMVEIDHGNGLSTRYAHLSQIQVSEGETINKGAVVGLVGTTGRSTGPHLHYEVRIDGEPVDPVRFLAAGARLASVEAH